MKNAIPYHVCAICEDELFFHNVDICPRCFKKYGKDAPWVKALIKIQNRNDYVADSAREMGIRLRNFSQCGLNMDGDYGDGYDED